MIVRLVLSSLITLLILFSQVAEATEFVVNQRDAAASDDNSGQQGEAVQDDLGRSVQSESGRQRSLSTGATTAKS